MKFYLPFFLCLLFMNCATIAQKQPDHEVSDMEMEVPVIPYYQIPEYPEKLTAGTSIARVLDGLGYRYYWATEGLTDKDLAYEPGNEGRPTKDVLDHLHGLSSMILNAAEKKPNIRPKVPSNLNWTAKRQATLMNIKKASDIFKSSSDEAIADFKIIFKRGDEENAMPVWHLFNGPIDDAISHVGQITSYRRSAGNPINPFVNVFMGKNKE